MYFVSIAAQLNKQLRKTELHDFEPEQSTTGYIRQLKAKFK